MLNETTLTTLPAGVQALAYRREAVGRGIVHFGVGNFFRAHEAWYVNQCLGLPGQSQWGIVGVGLNGGPRGEAKARQFQQQDCLYSLTEVAADGARTVSIIGALREYLLAPADPEAVLARLADPETRIVSMTITEGGYNIDEKTGLFRLDEAGVSADLAHPRRPATVFGYVVEGLRRRREAGVPPFTVLSCDNLRSNGHVARAAFVGYARAVDPDLAGWIEANVTFPCSMVDRITPGVDRATRQALNEASGLDDELPVLAEDFSQWVLEDNFCNGRPALEKAGVQFVDDVAGYEQVKVRMLNASHILLGAVGLLLGYRYAHETVADADLERLANAYWTLDAMPQIDAPAIGIKVKIRRRIDLRHGVKRPVSVGQALEVGIGHGFMRVAVAKQQAHGPQQDVRCVEHAHLHLLIARHVINKLHACLFQRGAAIAEIVLQHPLAEILRQHGQFVIKTAGLVQRLARGAVHAGRDAVDHGAREGDVGLDPPGQIGVNRAGIAHKGCPGDMAIAAQVIT